LVGWIICPISNGDRVLVTEDRCIAEMRKHAGLLQRRGAFCRLYPKPFRMERAALAL
jgi:ABC-type multidrug transport system fused ATPase/permease subunit